jgi:hypothetical protein
VSVISIVPLEPLLTCLPGKRHKFCRCFLYQFTPTASSELIIIHRFGTGIYTTTSSSSVFPLSSRVPFSMSLPEADDYFIGVPESPFRAVLVNRVVVGNPLTQQSNAEEITELPFGYHSVDIHPVFLLFLPLTVRTGSRGPRCRPQLRRNRRLHQRRHPPRLSHRLRGRYTSRDSCHSLTCG